MEEHVLTQYWEMIPIGKRNRVTYSELCDLWGMSKRMVRLILNRLASWDNGDQYILVRSSSARGFWRTCDRDEIRRYRREPLSRAKSYLKQLDKINRVLGDNPMQGKLDI